jgi:DNA (cytosine-5)-methyltransferase 1
LKNKKIDTILDFGETGFKGVLIETICLFIDKNKKPKNTIVKSITHNLEILQKQSYIMDDLLPYWIIYRNEDFDKVFNDMTFDIFNVFRDRQLTNSNTSLIPIENGVRVLKSRNISDNGQEIIDIDNYDSYITKEELQDKEIGKYLDRDDVYLVPNMTYYPRMMKKKKGVVVNGSLAILTLKDEKIDIFLTSDDLLYYSSNEFRTFYNIARNMQTRSLNIDKTSVFFFGVKKER